MKDPLPSEEQMFRVVLLVVALAVPVIALGLLAGPAWGAGLLGIELVIGLGLIWRRRRRSGAGISSHGPGAV